ncbi:MAG: 3-methyl-2-oxobutanoate hydroxymethyltransferase [bacterium]|nr:3-methyl-2-oxobutanoate hydroxymethyltransferase [Candidatus Sumerlaeota bacterium]
MENFKVQNGKAVREAKRRVHHFAMLKQRGQKIVMVTAYDYPTGLAADAAGVDAVLVGDSLGMVALGFDQTIPVTMDMMIHHTAAVRRAVKRAFLIGDLPFLSYKVSPEQALTNAGRFVQEAGAEAVKLEGGGEVAPMITKIVTAGIPVMGHIGLMPQSLHKHGGYRVQGRQNETAQMLVEDAKAIEHAGVFALVAEAVDPEAAAEICAAVSIPVIGIGASRICDGQVLVLSDLVGAIPAPPPKFVKRYTSVYDTMEGAIREFCGDVRSGKFPQEQHEY